MPDARAFACRPHVRRALLLLIAPLLPANVAEGDFEARVLAAHNAERAAMQEEPLRWSAPLAASAAEWANHLAAIGQLRHPAESDISGQGENLWAGTRDAYSPEDMVEAWISEKSDYKPGIFPDNSRSNDVGAVGHYTQIIWRHTREVGCARAANARMEFLVCRYAEPGNVFGQRPL